MRDVVISIREGSEFGPEDAGAYEILTPGILDKQGEDYVLTYNESELTGFPGTRTTLKIGKGMVEMTRDGKISSRTVFEAGKRRMSLRDMGECGFVTMGISARRVNAEFGAGGGTVDVLYAVDVDDRLTSINAMNIKVDYVQ